MTNVKKITQAFSQINDESARFDGRYAAMCVIDPVSVAAGVSTITDLLDFGVDGAGLESLLEAYKAAGGRSLFESNSAARATPLTTIENTLIFEPVMRDVLSVVENIYTAEFLIAASIHNNNFKGISVAKIIGKLNPNGRLAANSYDSQDASAPPTDQELLEITSDDVDDDAAMNAITIRDKASQDSRKRKRMVESVKDERRHAGAVTSIGNKDIVEKFNDKANIATGKMVQVNVQMDGVKLTIPVLVKLMITEASRSVIHKLFTFNSDKESVLNRTIRLANGSLSFWSDYILNRDLVKNKAKLMRLDKSGLVKHVEALKREAIKNARNIVANKDPRLAMVGLKSIIYVVSSNTIDAINATEVVNFDTFSSRQRIMDEAMAMMIVSVNTAEQIVTFYYDSITKPTIATFDDIKAKSKGGAIDIMAFMNALSNKTPLNM